MKYRVKVAQHRLLSVTVEAADGTGALKAGEAHVREHHRDGPYLGEPPWKIIATSAARIDDEFSFVLRNAARRAAPRDEARLSETAGDSAAAFASFIPPRDERSSERSLAPRELASSHEARGARPPIPHRGIRGEGLRPSNITRRFGLASLAAALLALHAPQARADISGSADEFIYTGRPFTTFQGEGCPHVCFLSGKVIISIDLAKYLDPESGYQNLIRVTQASPPGVYMTDGVHHPPPVPPLFTFEAFLNPGHTAIDFSQGWSLTAAWNPTPDGYENRFLSVYQGSLGAFGATTDETMTLDASGLLTAEAFNSNAEGGWVDPVVSVPEASTWAMLLVGFAMLTLTAVRRFPSPVRERGRGEGRR